MELHLRTVGAWLQLQRETLPRRGCNPDREKQPEVGKSIFPKVRNGEGLYLLRFEQHEILLSTSLMPPQPSWPLPALPLRSVTSHCSINEYFWGAHSIPFQL